MLMGLPGYAGAILFVDLTTARTKTEPLDIELMRRYIGGAGINNSLASVMPPDVNPLSPDNAIIIGTGPFSGTIIPGSSELIITYKSPLNHSFPCSCGGGRFALFLKSSGYDHVVLTGRSQEPVYLEIGPDNTRIHDASDLWGMDSFDTTDILIQRHEPCSVIPIGPAGENIVNISVTHIDKGGTVGSGGLPAVMGSKNLKAIVAVMGTKGIQVADPRRLNKLVDRILTKVNTYHLRDEMMSGGTMAMTSRWVPEGVIVKNATTLIPYPSDIKNVQSDIYEIHKKSRKGIACASCPMADKDRLDLPWSGVTIYDTAIMAERAITTTSPGFGHMDCSSPRERYTEALRYYDVLNRLGLDRTYSFRGLADFAISLYEEGIVTIKETGMELDRKLTTLIKLAEAIASREGFGDILADGAVSAAGRIGTNAGQYLHNVVKGQFVNFDPRLSGLGPIQFAQLTYPGRCFGVSGAMGAPTYSAGWPLSAFKKQAFRCGVPKSKMSDLFLNDTFNPALMTKHAEDFYCLFNMLGLCHRLYISRFFSLDLLSEMYAAVTGIDLAPHELKLASERTWNLWKLINHRAGMDREDDKPPEIWFQPLKGPDRDYPLMDYFQTHELQKEDVERLLDDYYNARGWDVAKGIPTEESP